MRRDRWIKVRVSSAEYRTIQSTVKDQGISLSSWLRFLALKLDDLASAQRSLPRLAAQLNRLDVLISSSDLETSPAELKAIVNDAIDSMRCLEAGLILPRTVEPDEAS